MRSHASRALITATLLLIPVGCDDATDPDDDAHVPAEAVTLRVTVDGQSAILGPDLEPTLQLGTGRFTLTAVPLDAAGEVIELDDNGSITLHIESNDSAVFSFIRTTPFAGEIDTAAGSAQIDVGFRHGDHVDLGMFGAEVVVSAGLGLREER